MKNLIKILFVYIVIQCIFGIYILNAQHDEITTYYVEHKYKDTSVIEITTCDDNVINNLCTASIIDSNNVHVYTVRDIFTKEDVIWYEFNFPIDDKIIVSSCVIDLDYDQLVSYPVIHRFRNFKNKNNEN